VAGKWNGLALRNPEYELIGSDEEDLQHGGRIVPLYRLTEGLSHRGLRRLVRTALDGLTEPFPETLPDELRERYGFPPADAALRAVHFPEALEQAGLARERFSYEELLAIQIAVLRARRQRRDLRKRARHTVDGPILEQFRASLPFALTAAQQCAASDILFDMASRHPMLRLLQGDVGCGKTLVALHAVAAAADGGFQTAVMAPTEILAEQHGIVMRDALAPLGLCVEVLTGSTANAKAIRQRILAGDVHVIVGTHALIQSATRFHNLGLVIIDEQHRFGVGQRAAMIEKGIEPDVLHMTATPIPRTLTITVYGGMDLSVIDEMPPGRTPVKTARVPDSKLTGLYEYIREQASKGLQTYIVCPLVEESDAKKLVAVTRHFEALSAGPLAGLRRGLLHGQMAMRDRETVMHRFKRREIDVLFSTSVIEVGIDCPNATNIVIEDAGQFGLTQLHQLRGRVGRGPVASHCFLLGKPKTEDGMHRLDILCSTSSGFDIAEADLELRGPGEFYGVRQAGLSDLRAADLIRDVRLLDHARRDAEWILDFDPDLALPEHQAIARAAAGLRIGDRLPSA
jgi:ATP-dependent DNA helicase RecG